MKAATKTALAAFCAVAGLTALLPRAGLRVMTADAAPPSFGLSGQMTQGGWARGVAPADVARLTLAGQPVAIAPDRRIFLAFDRDAKGAVPLVATMRDGRQVAASLAITPRAWQLEYIPLGPKPGTPPNEAYRIRREGELAQINEARATDHPADGWRQDFAWPLTGRISGRFGSQRIYNGVPGAYHSGLDIARPTGTPFVAPADGVVILAADSPFSLEGNLLMIDHGAGLNSAFLHASRLAVKVGDRVRQGQVIGYFGRTGRATGPHLHWSIKWRDARLDPLLFAPAHMSEGN
jgi:murein DD-endopeptidase MepM/ murein hydrolase activator NlpD